MTECVYVAVGANGLLKCGKTSQADARKRSLAREFKARGDSIVSFHSCAQLPHAYGAELGLINAIAARVQRAGGREWFRNGNFAHAVRAAEELTSHYAEVLAGWQPRVFSSDDLALFEARERERKALKMKRAVRAEQRLKQAAHRRRIRNSGLHSFDAIAALLIGQEGAPAVEPAKV